jgi:hypothetical protein
MADAYPPEPRPVERRRPPWWLIARGVGVASDPRSVVLAALGLTALRAGWAGLAHAMGPAHWLEVTRVVPSAALVPDRLVGGVLAAAVGLITPFVALFRPDVPAWGRIEAGLAALWALVVWGLFGGAIARVAAVRIAGHGRVGVLSALGFSGRRMAALVVAPIAPILVALLIGLAGAAVGLLDRLPSPFGPSAATVLAFVPLAVGLLDAVILLGLALAWPLMVATVVVDGEDSFDAISRSYSYVNQRTARYAASLALAAIVGAIGLAVVGLFVAAALGLADWSLGLGAPRGEGFRFLYPTSADRAGLPVVGHFWIGAVETLAAGWIFSYLWTTAAIVYLLLRHDVDGADIHDIHEPPRATEAFVPDEASS